MKGKDQNKQGEKKKDSVLIETMPRINILNMIINHIPEKLKIT